MTRAVAGLAAVLCAASARAEYRARPGLAAGIGLAYDVIGLQLQLGEGRWQGTFAVGFPAFGMLDSGEFFSETVIPGSCAVGARWYPPARDGLFVSLNAYGRIARNRSPFLPEDHPLERHLSLSVVVGWRSEATPLFFEIAAGPAVSYDFFYEADEPGFTAPVEGWYFGLFQPTDGEWWIPDLILAAGAEF